MINKALLFYDTVPLNAKANVSTRLVPVCFHDFIFGQVQGSQDHLQNDFDHFLQGVVFYVHSLKGHTQYS